MKPIIQLNKQYEYQQGGRARILCIDGHTESHPVVSMDGDGHCFSHTSDGVGHAKNRDLIEVVPLWEGEVWVHPNGWVRESSFYVDYALSGLKEFGWRKIKVKQEEPT